MTSPADILYERLQGRGPLTFDELPAEAQKAAEVYYGEEQDVRSRGFLFGLIEMTMEQAKAFMWEFRSGDLRESSLDTFEAWHEWYVSHGLDVDTYSENWPVILADSMEFDGFLEDGWHRFNSYIVQGRTSLTALVLLGSEDQDMSDDITIDVGGWPLCSGTKVKVYLEGETGRVYSYGDIGGNSMPGEAFHGLDVCLLVLDKDTIPEKLEEWLEERMDTLHQIHDCFEGSEWNGSNTVGRWRDDELAELLDDLERDLADEPVPSYWDAGDFIAAVDDSQLAHDVVEKGLDGTVEEYVDDGESNDYFVRADDLRDEIERRLQDYIADLQEDGDEKEAHSLEAALA